jgi:hypothetical protein
MWPRILKFLQQEVDEPVTLREAQERLGALAAEVST